ncbi:MAG: hypothetical protein WCO63_04365 [Bacteroidota bacterium]
MMTRKIFFWLLVSGLSVVVSCKKPAIENASVIQGIAIPLGGTHNGQAVQIYLYAKVKPGEVPGGSAYLKTTITDADSKFSFNGLSVGDYCLLIDFTIKDSTGAPFRYYGYSQVQINDGNEVLTTNINFIGSYYYPTGGGGAGSCPYVFTLEDGRWHFRGEIYAVAIFKSLQRDDYLPLENLKSSKNSIQIQLANRLDEVHHTDLTELIFVKNAMGTYHLLDKYGKIQTVSSPQIPMKATANGYHDVRSLLASSDNSYYGFKEGQKILPEAQNFLSRFYTAVKKVFWGKDGSNMVDLVVEYKKPKNVSSAKFIVKAKNPSWTSQVYYNDFLRKFGTYFSEWSQKQNSGSGESLKQWALDQGLPLVVYVETSHGWQMADYFDMVGAQELNSREMVMQIDLRDVDQETVKLKLVCGYNFWEVDYASLDFTVNQAASVYTCSASNVVSDQGHNFTERVNKTDDQFLDMNKGEDARLSFSCPVDYSPSDYSVFLHTNGYYNVKKSFSNNPEWLSLIGYSRPGAYTAFAREQYVLYHRKN